MQVTFRDINQSYGKQTLFNQLNLVIPSSQFFTLLGPSGCGKTTLLRLLAGFVRPDSGNIMFGEVDVSSVPVHRRDVGMVFQDYALFPDRSILANVCYGLSARNIPKKEATQRAMAMLERVGLHAFADRSPASLSGGQRQRAAMARALVIKPKLLLLDEPLSALDVKLRVELRTMIRELQMELNITTVFVTHDQEEALAMSDLVAVMNQGQVVQLGTPHEIYATPRTAFAADFVGSANLIPITGEHAPDADGVRRLSTPAGTLLTKSPIALSTGAQLAVRSEEIAFADISQAQEGRLTGKIEHVEFRGSITGYTVRTAAGPLRVDVVTQLQKRLLGRGETVMLTLPNTAHIVERA